MKRTAVFDEAPVVRDLVRWRSSAWRYVTRKGWSGPEREDLVQEMVVAVLENPRRRVTYAFTYTHALDRCNPRHLTPYGRERQSTTERLYDVQWHAQRPTAVDFDGGFILHAYLQHLPRHSWPWVIRWLYEGWRLGELAREAGVTAAAMTLRLRTIRAQLHRAGVVGRLGGALHT